jgi:uncharacterized protein
MSNKILLLTLSIFVICCSFQQVSLATSPGEIYEGDISLDYRNVTVYAPAVAQTEEGYVGVISTITVTIQNNGSGRVFVDTLPLTQIDMQGSARLAVKVAGALVTRDNMSTDNYDFFFVVRTSAPIIGGPSAGGVMTVATVALLENWDIDRRTVMTGMINPDGSIGPIGGIPQKIDAAYSVGAKRFLIPKGQGTYTEMVTETIQQNGWRRTVTYPVTRNVAEYAMENYGMEIVEVADINQALMNFTGYSFPIPESESKITTEDYVDSMKPLASTLLDDARQSFQNASDLVNQSSIPNRYPFYYGNQITDILSDAEERIEEAEAWYEQGLYYTSTSKSFQSLIDSRFVSYACEYFNADDENEYVMSLFDDVTSFYQEKSEEAKKAAINGMISLQCVGAAQKRVSEAGSYVSDAWESYEENDYLSLLYKLGFARERSKSVGWWLDITSHFNDSGEINASELDDLALEYIEDARQAATYSSVILQEMGKSSDYLASAQELLQSARDDLEKKYPAAALFEALEALVKANLAIETIDGVTQDKIERARESAGGSISESRTIGIEPVLAVSYYEYAESLVNESSLNSAIIYYKYSDIIAGAVGFTKPASSTSSSRYIGIPEINTPVWWRGMFDLTQYFIVFAVMSTLGGLLLGIVLGNIFSKRGKEKIIEQWVPKSIKDYHKKQKEQYFPDHQTPRSINDYYKKDK